MESFWPWHVQVALDPVAGDTSGGEEEVPPVDEDALEVSIVPRACCKLTNVPAAPSS